MGCFYAQEPLLAQVASGSPGQPWAAWCSLFPNTGLYRQQKSMLSRFQVSKTPWVHTDVRTADQLIELRCLVWPQILFPDPPPLLPEWVNHVCWEEIHLLKTSVKAKQICPPPTPGQLVNECTPLEHPTCLQIQFGTKMIAHRCPSCWLGLPSYPLNNFSDFLHDPRATVDLQSADTE